jgi:PAS domain S-box-containing protein
MHLPGCGGAGTGITDALQSLFGASANFVRFMVSSLLRCCCLLLMLAHLPAHAASVPLSDAQLAWLDENRLWRVGVVMTSPYAEYDQRQRRLSGFNVQFMERLAASLGVDLQWHRFVSEAELEKAMRADQIDLAPGLRQTREGLRIWRYSDPFLRVPRLIIGDINGPRAIDLERLNSSDVIALEGPGPVADYMSSNYPSQPVLEVPSQFEALRQLLEARVRFAVVDEPLYGRLSQKAEYASLEVVGDLGNPQLLRIGSRRDSPVMSAVIDLALRHFPAPELSQLQEQWLKSRSIDQSRRISYWRSLSLLLTLLLMGAVGVLVWQRRQQGLLETRLKSARRDIELRAAAEEAQRLTQFCLDHSTVGILWLNWDSHVRYANQAAEGLLGYASERLLDQPLQALEPGLGMDDWLQLWRDARSGAEDHQVRECEWQRADGSRFPVAVTLSFLRFGSKEYLVVFLADITERRRASAALQESEVRLKAMAGNVPGLVFRLERQGAGAPVSIAYISEASQRLVGYSPELLLQPGRGIRSLVHPDDEPRYWSSQQQALDSMSDWYWQGRILTRAGDIRWADIRASVRGQLEGRQVWDGIVWDITDNKRIELELDASRAQLRKLAAHVETVREEEKAHIAREVHDELGQMLTVLKLEISMCEISFAQLDPGLAARLQGMKRLIAQLFQQVRDVATALRPPILDAGIASAIDW